MGAKVEISPARLCDVWAFEKMRPADAAEVMASGGFSPVEAIIESWAVSKEAWVARFNGEVGVMYGVAVHPAGEAMSPTAVVWALSTPVIEKYPVAFYRHCKPALDLFYRRYGRLYNFIDTRNRRALSWARRVGFEIFPPIKYGQGGELFHPIAYGR